MSLSEFDLIARYFGDASASGREVMLGVGDDAALLSPPPEHFLSTVVRSAGQGDPLRCPGPAALAHRTLALAINALAARGVEARWALQSLTLPRADDRWLTPFSEALLALARRHGVALVGGDTTRGPLALTLVVHGLAETRSPPGVPRPGDLLYVTGEPGPALPHPDPGPRGTGPSGTEGGALERRLFGSEPRTALAALVRRHGCRAASLESGLAAAVRELLDPALGAALHESGLPPPLPGASVAGDPCRDACTAPGAPELCFTVPPDARAMVEAHLATANVPNAPVGVVEGRPGIRLLSLDGRVTDLEGLDP